MSQGRKPHRVLLIDDSPSVRTLVRLFLMKEPLDFVEAPTAEDGLQRIRAEPFDLVITDHTMPGMTGTTLVKLLRCSEDARLRTVPVVMMSSDPRAESLREESLTAGVNAFVRKPVSQADLLGILGKLLPAAA